MCDAAVSKHKLKSQIHLLSFENCLLKHDFLTIDNEILYLDSILDKAIRKDTFHCLGDINFKSIYKTCSNKIFVLLVSPRQYNHHHYTF